MDKERSVTSDDQHLRPSLKHKIAIKWERKIKIDQQQEIGAGTP